MNADETTCPECAETIKAAAKVCKHCGYRLDQPPCEQIASAPPEDQPRAGPLLFVKVGLVALAAVILSGVIVMHYRTRVAAGEIGQPSNREKLAANEQQAKAYITKDFLDPNGAEFRNVSALENCVTGEVNGKNSFGAFIGFSRFYYSIPYKTGQIDEGAGSAGMSMPAFNAANERWMQFNNRQSNCILGRPLDAPERKAATATQ